MNSYEQKALAIFAEGQSKLWTDLAISLASVPASIPATGPGPAAPTMTQTTAWYAKHGSVLKKVEDNGGMVSFADFLKFADEAGYSGASYSQMYRKDGLLARDKTNRSMSLTSKGIARLAYAKKYLSDRGFQL